MRGLQPRTFHRAVWRACGGPGTVTLTGAPAIRGGLGVRAEVDRAARKGYGWECTSWKCTQRKLCTRMQRGGALADSRRVLQDATDSGGAPLPSSRKDVGERIEVGDDRGGAYKVPSADAPIRSRQKESSEDSERKRNLKNISFQKSERSS